jgi:hypothetical protein
MTSTCTALIVPARFSEPVRVENLIPDLRTLQTLVGGDIESVTRGDWRVYLNADCMIADLPSNLRAVQLMYDCGLDLADVARGTAVFLGKGDHGGDSDVPVHLIRRAEQLCDTSLAA